MTSAALLAQRLRNQQLIRTQLSEPQAVVAWMGAMQAQEYAMAKWAIGLRLPRAKARDAVVEAAFDRGEILRTHVLRPTWHFVAPADIRWILALTAPRVRQAMSYMDRQLDVNANLIRRSRSVIIQALQGGNQLTRDELQLAFTRAKITAKGPRLAHLLMHAELDALICSGPRRARRFTYMLLDERVAATQPLSRDVALAELARRYFRSRAPAAASDFSWWSGLTIKDARAGVSMLEGEFTAELIGGREYFLATNPISSSARTDLTCLLPDYDEYGIAYRDRRSLFPGAEGATTTKASDKLAYNRMIIIDGRIAGTWKRSEREGRTFVHAALFSPVTKIKRHALDQAVQRFGTFIGQPAQLI